MYKTLNALLDWFIPEALRTGGSDHLMVRNFVLLHLLGPLMGHSVTGYLLFSLQLDGWQFWVLEAGVASFFLVPFILRWHGDMRLPTMLSVQMLVGVSLFGSFFFGGISSPLLPWFLIAMMLGFFYLADHFGQVLAGIGVQLAVFITCRLILGEFPELVGPSDLFVPNILSIIASLTYMIMLCLFYEAVMRFSLRLEQETIDQRLKIEVLRSAMNDAQVASRRKSIFLAKMSHELRTPLNAVIGYTEMLKESWEESGRDGRKSEDLSRIHAAGRHLLALVNEVIDLSSIEGDRVELHNEPVMLSALIDDVVFTASALVRKRENRLIVNMPDDLGVLELDALKLRQSLLNLLSNAAKFTTKGIIMLTVLKSWDERGELVSFEVTDNGIGMKPEALSRIFESFEQADNETVSRFGGTGLGLALTRRFCEMMGGTIQVRSEYGVGTSFTLTVPYRPAAMPQASAA